MLSRLGLTVPIAAHTGAWVDFVPPGDGLAASVVDENYGLTVRLPTPTATVTSG